MDQYNELITDQIRKMKQKLKLKSKVIENNSKSINNFENIVNNRIEVLERNNIQRLQEIKYQLNMCEVKSIEATENITSSLSKSANIELKLKECFHKVQEN